MTCTGIINHPPRTISPHWFRDGSRVYAQFKSGFWVGFKIGLRVELPGIPTNNKVLKPMMSTSPNLRRRVLTDDRHVQAPRVPAFVGVCVHACLHSCVGGWVGEWGGVWGEADASACPRAVQSYRKYECILVPFAFVHMYKYVCRHTYVYTYSYLHDACMQASRYTCTFSRIYIMHVYNLYVYTYVARTFMYDLTGLPLYSIQGLVSMIRYILSLWSLASPELLVDSCGCPCRTF